MARHRLSSMHLLLAAVLAPGEARNHAFMFNRHQDAVNRCESDDLSESRATKCNMARGLTAIEAEALGHREVVLTRLFENA